MKLRHAAALALFGTVFIACTGKTPDIAGDWKASPQVAGRTMHLTLHVATDEDGNPSVSLDSIDDGAMGLSSANVVLKGNVLSFDVPSVNGSYKGTVSSDAKTIKGEWTKGDTLPLDFAR